MDDVRDAVESIFCRKLGLADHLEYGRLAYMAKPCVYRAGVSPILVPGDEPDPLRMINILVRLERGREFVPPFTASYSALQWFDAQSAVDLMRRRGKFAFGSGQLKSEVLCGGICICTAEVLLRNVLAGGTPHQSNNEGGSGGRGRCTEAIGVSRFIT